MVQRRSILVWEKKGEKEKRSKSRRTNLLPESTYQDPDRQPTEPVDLSCPIPCRFFLPLPCIFVDC